jgi:hypothetical protein
MDGRDPYKLMGILRQPGGLKTMTDADLTVLVVGHCRSGLAAAEGSKRGHKAPRGWAESLRAVEAELAARRDQAV